MATEHAHLALAVDVINPRDVGQGEHAETPDNPDYPWHFLAEGDSWFTIAAIPSSNSAARAAPRPLDPDPQPRLPGRHPPQHRDPGQQQGPDPISREEELLQPLRRAPAERRRQRPDQWRRRADPQGAAPRRRSGGGGSYVDAPAYAALLLKVQEAFATIVSVRDSATSLSRGSPAFVHTYDYATPRDAPARFVGAVAIAGPWLFKAFAGSGIDISLQQRIADLLTDGLADALLALDSASAGGKALPAFHVIDTRDTLVRANPTERGNSNDWINEIHPNLGGYRKIAARLSAKVNEVLLG